jgi:hypothetical protein
LSKLDPKKIYQQRIVTRGDSKTMSLSGLKLFKLFVGGSQGRKSQEIVNQIIVYLRIGKLSLAAGVVLGNRLAYNLTLL